MRKSSVFHKFGWNLTKKSHINNAGCHDSEHQAKWLHHGKEIKDTFIAFNAKYLGAVEVSQPKGVEMVKESIKKLKIARQLKKAEAGHKGSKLIKVEIIISIDAIKVVEIKNKNMICARPLQRVSYCADDHRDKRLFAFIAKEQESKCHKCFVFVSEREASEITLTLGQAFQLAYKRYLEKEKAEIKQNKDSINIEKEISILKQENVRLKQELDSNKLKEEPHLSLNLNSDTSSSTGNNSALYSETDTPIKSSLPTASFGFIAESPTNMNDISFDVAFDQLSDNNFDPRTTNNKFDHFNDSNFTQNVENANKIDSIDIFGTHDGSPRDEDFCVKHDPFADTPDWSSVASEESTKQAAIPNQFVNGTVPNNTVNEPCGNPFATSSGILNASVNHNVNNDLSLDDKSFHEQNTDLFSQYLSNVVAQRTSSDASLNGVSNKKELFFKEGNNNDNSIDANFNQFNVDDQFSANNEFGFNKLNLADASGNMINEFNETDDGFFPDANFVQRPKAHTITVLTNQNFPNFSSFTSSNDSVNKSNLTASGNSINEVDESGDGFFSNENCDPRPKAQSCGASYNQVVRPRPSSFCIQNQNLPGPPSKQSLKKPSCIKTPTLKVLSSSPLKEEPRQFSSEEKEILSSPRYVLPNVKNTAPIPAFEMRSRSRSRAAPLQAATPLKESIFRASKSLEDLCSIDSQSPRNTTSSKAANPFSVTSPVSQFQR